MLRGPACRAAAMTSALPADALAIPVHDLDAGGKEVRLPLGRSWMTRALEGTGITPGGAADTAGELDVRLSKSGTDVVVHGELRGELTVPCARCLEPARVAVHEPISVLAVPGSVLRERDARDAGDEEGDGDGDEGDDDVIPYDGDTLVLDDLVRDELVLAVPMIPLCSEGCAGIRPLPPPPDGTGGQAHPGTSIDPRLRPLLSLKKS